MGYEVPAGTPPEEWAVSATEAEKFSIGDLPELVEYIPRSHVFPSATVFGDFQMMADPPTWVVGCLSLP